MTNHGVAAVTLFWLSRHSVVERLLERILLTWFFVPVLLLQTSFSSFSHDRDFSFYHDDYSARSKKDAWHLKFRSCVK